MEKNTLKTRNIALIGVMGGLGAVLMMIRFPLPFMPPFMDFDFAGLVEIIGGFALGPVAAVFIIVVKILVKMAILGTNSALTGEIQNILLSCAYVLPAIWIYDRKKTKGHAVAGMAVGTVICAVVAIFTNMYMIIPFYVKLFGMSMQEIIDMCHAINPAISNPFTFALFGIVPFNLIKNGVTSLITYFAYKKISVHIKHFVNR
ncbi:ECF transporter S component [Clostridium sp. AM58-1XD]|uniref:ECF transporter S component n=1 Tax=Clostridium sp. AM58-1XD TaxID=2292307 RepID=UPI000E501861|nr:ECF transporter S component [Clostridium sp. AM58-1XD]RGY95712.1 ECF transporter S component [Clostridium sp. AM58-1XD]